MLDPRFELNNQVLKCCENLRLSANMMINARDGWIRDAFYLQAMEDVALLSERVGEWRLKVMQVQQNRY